MPSVVGPTASGRLLASLLQKERCANHHGFCCAVILGVLVGLEALTKEIA